MSERFVFKPNPPLQAVLNALGTERGAQAVSQVVTEFSSLVDALHHTQGIGSNTFVHLPDGNVIAFINVNRIEVANAAYDIAVVNGFNIV